MSVYEKYSGKASKDGNRSAEEIQRDVQAILGEMGGTLQQIESRVSPKEILARSRRQAAHLGREWTGSLKRSVRNHPARSAGIGLGTVGALVLAGLGGRRARQFRIPSSFARLPLRQQARQAGTATAVLARSSTARLRDGAVRSWGKFPLGMTALCLAVGMFVGRLFRSGHDGEAVLEREIPLGDSRANV